MALQVQLQGQQAGQHHAKGRAREYQAAQARPIGVRCNTLAEAGDHHQHPGAGDAQGEAQQDVGPETFRRHRGQGQQRSGPESDHQTQASLARRPDIEGIQCADQVAQVVGGGHQGGAGQAYLAFGDQVRQLRGEGKAANAHGDEQGQKAGE
ncbi:hypothetical protein D3C80_1698440 [compost metagenome]